LFFICGAFFVSVCFCRVHSAKEAKEALTAIAAAHASSRASPAATSRSKPASV
jgi:hypothetical protein